MDSQTNHREMPEDGKAVVKRTQERAAAAWSRQPPEGRTPTQCEGITLLWASIAGLMAAAVTPAATIPAIQDVHAAPVWSE